MRSGLRTGRKRLREPGDEVCEACDGRLKGSMKRILISVVFLAALIGAGVIYQRVQLSAQTKEAGPAAGRPQASVPVVATTVIRKPTPVRLEAIGTVQTMASVVVKSRIDGQIVKVHIRDGQEVKAGDPLFTLDSRAVLAQQRQAEATVAKDQAMLENAKREADRQGQLASKNYTSAAVFDTARTSAASLEATLRADVAALDNIKVQLSYYTITTPIDGRAGAVALKAGNNVKANDTITLVTINQVHPIYVGFSVPQDRLAALREAMADHELEVEAQVPGSNLPPEVGKLAFIDNSVDPTTGTIALKGVFTNDKDRLWPGQFVNAGVTLRVQPDALVIPTQAVQVGQKGNFVFVIKPDKTVEARQVTIGRSAGGEAVIAKGLDLGEQVVVDGQLRLTNGSRVEPRPLGKDAGGAGATS
jgi:multidrug efflux system membrane fusion protein